MTHKTTQLVCPICKHEFKYDNGQVDKDIADHTKDILKITSQLTMYNTKTTEEKKKNLKWYNKAKMALEIKKQQLTELKNFRKLAEQHRSKQEYQAFKNAVKDICGEDVFRKCIEKTNQDVSAYNISDTAKVTYTRTGGESITSINKL